MAKIKPTVGRRVWFHPADEQDGDQPLDAGIAYVHDDETINISYSDKFGNMAAAQKIYLWDGEVEAERPVGEAYCEWMPYQKAQANEQARQQALASAGTSKKVAELLKK